MTDEQKKTPVETPQEADLQAQAREAERQSTRARAGYADRGR